MNIWLEIYLFGAIATCLIITKLIIFAHMNGQTINSKGISIMFVPIIGGIIWVYALPIIGFNVLKNLIKN